MSPVLVLLLLIYSGGGGGSVVLESHSTNQQVARAEEHQKYIEMLHTMKRDAVGTDLLSINCSEIGWTFFYEPPFLHQKLPKCGDVIQPQ